MDCLHLTHFACLHRAWHVPCHHAIQGHDRDTIDLPGEQVALAKALHATGTPLVCVLIHGGGLGLDSLLESCDAIVDGWYPGSEGGGGIADVIFGVVNPAGRAPQTFYAANSSLPLPGQMDLYAGQGATYRHYRGNVRTIRKGAGKGERTGKSSRGDGGVAMQGSFVV